MPRCIYVSHRPARFRRRLSAAAEDRSQSDETQLLSRAADGGSPNDQSSQRGHLPGRKGGPQRRLRVRGSNIVAGETNELPNVFVVDRAPGYSIHGSPCRNGTTRIASRGLGGAANGGSYGPAISGGPSSDRGRGETAPRCVAFVSEASNPVAGGTNGRPDAFVYWLASGESSAIGWPAAAASPTGRPPTWRCPTVPARRWPSLTRPISRGPRAGGKAHPNYQATTRGSGRRPCPARSSRFTRGSSVVPRSATTAS